MFKNLFLRYDKLLTLSNIDFINFVQLKEIISKKININKNDFYLICNDKLLVSINNLQENDSITVIRKLKGGVLFFAGQIASIAAVIVILIVLMKPLLDIIKIMTMIINIAGKILALFPKVFETILLVFNPKKLIDDIIYGVSFGIKSVIGGMMSSISSGSSPNPVEETPESIPKVCVPPTLFNLIILIICPPLALVMNIGTNNFYLTIICAILTIWGYYFPGLIFAALHIFC